MPASDAAFSGSIPALYHLHLGPLLFQPYAEDIAKRAEALAPSDILETAAGTGIVTHLLAQRLPGARLTATDLNQAMLDVAAADADRATLLRQADAQALPFEDGSFDLVLSQFGVMFFPDRAAAYREALRVLRPNGVFLFNVWDSLDRNPVPQAVSRAVAALFPHDPPGFIERTPFGYHDQDRIHADLRAAGFQSVRIETVEKRSCRPAAAAAIGLCQGSPLGAEIAARDPARADDAVKAATEAVARLGTFQAVDAPMSALVIEARP